MSPVGTKSGLGMRQSDGFGKAQFQPEFFQLVIQFFVPQNPVHKRVSVLIKVDSAAPVDQQIQLRRFNEFIERRPVSAASAPVVQRKHSVEWVAFHAESKAVVPDISGKKTTRLLSGHVVSEQRVPAMQQSSQLTD